MGVTRSSEWTKVCRVAAYTRFTPLLNASSTSARPMPRFAPVIRIVLFSMFILVILSVCCFLPEGYVPTTNFYPFSVSRSRTSELRFLQVALCPAAHAPEWSDDCLSRLRQRVLDSNGYRLRHAPRDYACGFEIAKRPSEHSLRDATQSSPQLQVPIGTFFERKQNLGCPSADEDGRGQPCPLCRIHAALPSAKPL